MQTEAVVLEAPQRLGLRPVSLDAPGPDDLVVETEWSGISTGTEKLLCSGRMPPFPGLGYPLVPGYETVGRVSRGAGGIAEGARVFVPGARCFGEVRGLFGGAAARLVVPASRAIALDPALGQDGVLISLAATAHHALFDRGAEALPDLVIGHGVLGRLVARIAAALGAAPVVHEVDPARLAGAEGYTVLQPEADDRRDYARILDASGAPGLIDAQIPWLAKGGEIVLAGFYEAPLSFVFPPAFMREARIRIAAEFTPGDLAAVTALAAEGRLSLAGLITHTRPAAEAARAYETAFEGGDCLKMVLDWRTPA
ncbi:MAG: chlorophyll synthesis pathway protein BchC [Pseudomonadota bacterium]